MNVWNDIDQFPKIGAAVVTAGTFDGVHTGHRRIIDRLKNLAQSTGGKSVILTFHPHPRMVLYPDDHDLKLLTTLEERIDLLEELDIDHLVIIPFTHAFSRLSSLNFVREILVNKLGTKRLVIGYNHHFGRNREGTFAHLQEFGPLYGFEVEEIPAFDVDRIEISSTKIRLALQKGDVKTAERFLGYPYRLRGKVVEGEKKGRMLGFPTANLEISDPNKLIPANGVYEVTSKLGGTRYKGMMNIGTRPTMGGMDLQLEVHLLDFSGDIYGITLEVEFRKRIRDEKKFPGAAELREQLLKDRQQVLKG